MTLNGIQSTAPKEEFFLARDPIHGGPIEPEQAELPLKKTKPGTFTRNAKALIKRSGPKKGSRKDG